MKRIRNIIRKILAEIIDTPEIPQNIIRGKNSYSFICEHENYGVIFQDFSKNKSISIGLNNKKVKNAIKKSKKTFQVDFGLLDKNRKLDAEKNTKFFKHIDILNGITAIIREFIIENQVEVLTYLAEKKRRNIYKNIFMKFLKDDFYYFEKNEMTNNKYEVFFIKNDLLK